MSKVAVGSGLGRFAKASDEYVKEIVSAKQKLGGRKLSAAQKQEKLALILSDRKNGMQRLGQSMIGPIQLKLRYQGITRNVLLEDPLTPGIPIEYDVLDDLGQAYILAAGAGEVKITPMEGKRVPVALFRIATFPRIKKEDLYYLRVNSVEYAQDEAKQAIMKQEDSRLVTLMEAAITAYASIDPLAVGGGDPHSHTITPAAGYLSANTLYDAVATTDEHELDAARLLFSPRDYRDLYRWDINTTGWAFKDRVVAGERVVQFGEFQVGKSVIIPKKTIYLTPEPNFLGVFPVMYSLDVEENNQVEQFYKGWVLDELVGMAILNPRGLVKIVKS
jgi:hypothetical protein